MIEIILKQLFILNVPSKVLLTLITVLSNYFNGNCSASILVCPFSSRRFLVLKWCHSQCHLACEKICHLIFSLVLVGVFIAYILAFSVGMPVPSTLSILLYLHTTGKWSFYFYFFLSLNIFFSQDWVFIIISLMFLATIWSLTWLCCSSLENLFVGWKFYARF